MIHEIKCLKEFFEEIIVGDKTFEVRKNDRDYKIGDYLAINEVVEDLLEDDDCLLVYTGRSALFKITYILDNTQYTKPGYVILGIAPCHIRECLIGNLTVIKRSEK